MGFSWANAIMMDSELFSNFLLFRPAYHENRQREGLETLPYKTVLFDTLRWTKWASVAFAGETSYNQR
jgi:hypothetical protein